MKKLYFFTLLNLFVAYTNAQYFQWAKREGKDAYDYGYGVSLDNSGNVYVAGKYEQMGAIFSGQTVTCAGNHDIYLVKYDPSGAMQWIRTGGGTLGDYAHANYCDGSNVYIAGEIEGYNNPVSFSNSSATLMAVGDNDVFLAKYDLNGNLAWAKSEGWLRNEKALGVTSDNSGNIYICGYYTDTTKFNGAQINGFGFEDIFLAKYDANGNFQWVKNAGSPGRDEAKSVRCDAAGNIYICGMIKNGANFSGTTLTCTPNYFDAFVAKYDPSGNLVWVKSGGSAYDDVAWSLTLDSQGKIYVTGEFNAYATFGPNSLATTGNADVFVLCYDANGAEQWFTKAGGPLIDRARGIGTDGTNLFITGQFGSTAAFGGQSVTAADSSDIFVAAFNNSGTYLWAAAVGGTVDAYENLGYESGIAVTAEPSGNVYATGALLDGGIFGGTTLSPYARTDMFITKLNATPAGIKDNSYSSQFDIYPNPANGIFDVRLNSTSTLVDVKIYNSTGALILNKSFKNASVVSVDIADQPAGIYFVEIKGTDAVIGKKKIIVQH